MTTTPTTESFDAFEQRLAAVLATEAERVAAPDDGLALIRGRVAHRRRARRATWVAAAAALVLIAGIVGLALRPTDQGSTPYVDTRPTVPTDGPPLLAPVDPGLTISVMTWDLGRSYGLRLFDPNLLFVGQTTVEPAIFSVRPGPTDEEPGPWEPIEVAGHAAELRLAPSVNPSIRWVVAPGYMAEVSIGITGERASDTTVATMRSIVEKVQPVYEDTMGTYVDRTLSNGDPSAEPRFRLGLVRDGRTFVRSVFGVEVVSTLTVEGLPTNTFQLRSKQILGQPYSLPTGTATTVRGHEGVLTTQTDLDGNRHHVLVWTESDWEHRLYFTDAVSTSEAMARTTLLEVLPDTPWQTALFPSAVPSDLAPVLWVSSDSDSDQTTATTATGSGP